MNRRRFLAALGGVTLSLLGTGAVTGSSRTRLHGQESGAQGYAPLGRVEVPNAYEAAVHHDGDVAYVATGDGFVSVDISDPTEPELLAERRDIDPGDDRETGGFWDLWPDGDRLVVVGPAGQAPDLAYGFALFDVSDPAAPEQIAWYDTDHYVHNGFFADDRVYLTGSGLPTYPLVVVDVADDEPEELGRWSIVDYDSSWEDVPISVRVLHDVYVQDGIAYLPSWDAGTWIVDVSDPADPTVLSHVGEFSRDELAELTGLEAGNESTVPPGNAHYAEVNEEGSVLLVGKEAWEMRDPVDPDETVGGPGGVTLWDVSDAESPEQLAHIEAPESFDNTQTGWFTTAHNADIVDGRLYCSWYFGGVTVHDVSDPADPDRLVWWRDPHEASFWTAQSVVPGETFIASSHDFSGSEEIPTETPNALYVFPDESGEQADPPDLTAPPFETPTPTATPTPTPTPTPESTPSPTPVVTPTMTATPDEAAVDTDDDGAGFGVAGALAGVGGAALALARRLDTGGDGE